MAIDWFHNNSINSESQSNVKLIDSVTNKIKSSAMTKVQSHQLITNDVSYIPTIISTIGPISPTSLPYTSVPTNTVIGQWTTVAKTGVTSRQQHSSVINTATGLIYTIGGFVTGLTSYLSDVWIFNIQSGKVISKIVAIAYSLTHIFICTFTCLFDYSVLEFSESHRCDISRQKEAYIGPLSKHRTYLHIWWHQCINLRRYVAIQYE